MKKALLLLVVWSVAMTALTAQAGPRNFEFRNGVWYNGTDFSPAVWYTTAGKLTQKAPAKIDSVIDLSGRWVVPPMGDAFCASVTENPSPGTQLKMYADEGIFYLQIPGNTQEGRKAVESLVNKYNTPDVAFANGALTCTLGYPFLQYEGPAQGIRNPQVMTQRYDQVKLYRKMLGNGYWFLDSKDSLDKNWSKILMQKPAFVTIYLLEAEKNGGKEGKGLTADMAKLIIKKAHKAQLGVFAVVETADDLRLGLTLGVDGFANLPGQNWDRSGDPKRYELTEDDIAKLAKKKLPVVPLLSHNQTTGANPELLQQQAKLLRNLLDKGVNVVIGSNDPMRTTRGEIGYWFQLPDLNYTRAVKILCENTPQAIFPKRKIGRIAEGYEASFLVLDDNPLVNLLKLRAISFKVKNGVLLK